MPSQIPSLFRNEGNLIFRTQTSTGDVWTYSFDYHNNLTKVVETSGGSVVMEATYKIESGLEVAASRSGEGLRDFLLLQRQGDPL